MKYPTRLLLLMAFVLGACTTPPSTPGPASPSPRPRNTATAPARVSSFQALESKLRGMTIKVWHPWFGTDASRFESIVQEFNSGNPWGFQAVSTGQVSYGVLYDNVTTALPTDDRPDMVIALPEQARAWDEEGYVVDLAPYVKDPVYGWTAEELKDIPDIFILQEEEGERLLALPYQRSARFLLWNKDWAGELGFAAPPDTPDDFYRQACAATRALTSDATSENDGLGGWLVDTDAMTAYSWMRAFEGGVLEGSDYRFMTPNNIEAYKFLRKLQEDGCAWMPSPEVNLFTAFSHRSALFVTAGLEDFTSVTRAYASASNSDNWIPLAFPGESEDAVVLYGSSLVMLESTDEAQLASWLFMDWLLSAENDARASQATGLFPIRSSSIELMGDYASSHPRWIAALELIDQADIQPQLGSWRTVRVMLEDGFTQMFRVSLPSGQVAVILAQMESTSRELSR